MGNKKKICFKLLLHFLNVLTYFLTEREKSGLEVAMTLWLQTVFCVVFTLETSH